MSSKQQLTPEEKEIEFLLSDPEVQTFAVDYLSELQAQAEMESFFERADEEMSLDLMFAHRHLD